MNCIECKSKREPDAVPYIVHEAALSRMERTGKRLWIALLIMIFLFVGTNAAWLWYESQFEITETITQEVVQDAETGTNNFVGGDVYGTTGYNND